jgi:anthranilate 1,2-dioxygenase small subunit
MANNVTKIAAQPVDGRTYDKVTDLMSGYAHALDDGHIDQWPGFFTEDALYHVTTRENHDQGLPIGIIRCSGRGMMVDRVKAFHTANIFEPHHYNHLIGPAMMGPGAAPGAVASRCNFQIVRIMENGRMDLFATGKYLDEVVFEAGVPKFKQRIVVLDSRNVDILVVVPL